MKLRYTILYVEDVPATIEFYENAFGFKRKMLHPEGDFGELDTGETSIAFSSLSLMDRLNKNPGRATINAPVFEIAFETDDVQSALDKAIEAGAKPVQGVEEMEWGQTTAYVADPNGFLVEICTAVKG